MLAPSLSLDFTQAVLDPRITFTRAAATATRVNASGLIEAVAADTPRFNYSPVTLACRGLLVEEARTNFLYPSANLTLYSAGIFVGCSAAQLGDVAPDGSTTATRITSSSGGGYFEPARPATSTSPCGSLYVKGVGTTIGKTCLIRLVRDGYAQTLTSGTFTYTGDWQRISFAGTFSAAPTTTRLRVDILTSGGAAGEQIIVWGLQLEAGADPTSLIPTTSAAVARNPDIATITGANFSDWWQASKGGVLVRARPGTVSGVRPWVQFDDGTANEIIALRGNTTNPELYIVDGGTPQAQIDAGTIAVNTDYSLTGWWATNDCKARLDSGAVVTDTSATIPTVTQARLGSDGTNYLNGHLASISYYDSFSEQIYTRRKNKAVFNLM